MKKYDCFFLFESDLLNCTLSRQLKIQSKLILVRDIMLLYLLMKLMFIKMFHLNHLASCNVILDLELSDLVISVVDDVLEPFSLRVPALSSRTPDRLFQIFHPMLHVQLLLDPLVAL